MYVYFPLGKIAFLWKPFSPLSVDKLSTAAWETVSQPEVWSSFHSLNNSVGRPGLDYRVSPKNVVIEHNHNQNQQINHNQQHELEPPSNEDIARFCLINTLSTWKTRTKLSHKLVPVCPLKEKICMRESFSFWIQKFHDFEEILAKVTETLVQQRYIRIFTIKGPGILLSPLANRLASCHDT